MQCRINIYLSMFMRCRNNSRSWVCIPKYILGQSYTTKDSSWYTSSYNIHCSLELSVVSSGSKTSLLLMTCNYSARYYVLQDPPKLTDKYITAWNNFGIDVSKSSLKVGIKKKGISSRCWYSVSYSELGSVERT